jgi:hypothetical protein
LKTKVKLILWATEDVKKNIDWSKAKPIMDEALTRIENDALSVSS